VELSVPSELWVRSPLFLTVSASAPIGNEQFAVATSLTGKEART
jgi:hypothetical protein